METGDAVQRTVVASAPATDSITQTQIALNNLLDQVRETFLFLLEGAPPLSTANEFVNVPEDTLSKWKKYRKEFEDRWRLGKPSTQQAAAAEDDSNKDEESEDEEDLEAEALPTGFVPPTLGPESIEAVKNDTLFRTQRIATIAQSIRALVPKLPSTLLADGTYVSDPHKNEVIAADIKFWQQANDALEPILETHTAALKMCLDSVDEATAVLAQDIINQASCI